MKAITLHQPWAMLVAVGAKRYETRSWNTRHRGLIAIHAASKDLQKLGGPAFRDPFVKYCSANAMCFGAIIAVAEIKEVHPASDVSLQLSRLMVHAPKEEADRAYEEHCFGDFQAGRFAWELQNVRRLNAIWCPGRQQLWNVPAAIEAKILAQLSTPEAA